MGDTMEWLGEVFVKLKFILRELLISSKYRKRLKNNSFTLITNDCTAGAIYKDLHVRFNTPTINLYMNADDFLKFVNNLSQYMGEEITPYESGGVQSILTR